MKILASPAFDNKEGNPYNYLLYTNLQSLEPNIIIEDFKWEKLSEQKWDILHFHWPETFFNKKNRVEALKELVKYFIIIKTAKRQNTKIVWTIHNLEAHSRLYPRMEKWYKNWFIKQIDGAIALTESGLELAHNHFPTLKDVDTTVVYHGHYKDSYRNDISKKNAKEKLDISEYETVFTYFGQIKEYKNIPELINQFQKMKDESSCLLIAGKPESEALKERIEILAKTDNRIKLFLEFIDDDDVQLYMNVADVVVLPYKEILNSGTALLALSFNRPLLVPNKGALKELRNQFGETIVFTYNHSLSVEDLEKTSQALKLVPSNEDTNFIDEESVFNWREGSRKTLEFYKSLLK
ncbi:glycosyltransferase family 4 protein [Salinibacillus kushneri]|uniref:glycosyltransferase family 4 protein n=1 Tax=Salinibacillus kushneri TaxID=237682 RepID=UPI000B87A9A9|nr:glycosyltransferase [Salinibacillus kushneri]